MGLFGFLGATERQINPFDNGATAKNPQGNGQKQSTVNQVKNVGAGFAKGAVAPFTYLAKTDVINPVKSITGLATGNNKAYSNAENAENKLATPRQVIGNSTQALATVLGGKIASSIGEKVVPGVFGFLAPKIAAKAVTSAATKTALGVGGELLPKGLTTGLKLASGPVAGAVIGAPFGAGSTIASEQPLTAKTLLHGTTQGIESGAALGITGEAAGLATKGVIKGVKGTTEGIKAINETAFTPRVNLEHQAALKAISDHLAGDKSSTPANYSAAFPIANDIAKQYGIDITSGPPATRLAAVNSLLDTIGQKNKALSEGGGGTFTNPFHNPEESQPQVTPQDLHELSKADNLKDVTQTLSKITDPVTAGKIAPAILETKDPGVIDNIITRASNPKEQTLADIQQAGNSRPNASIQTQIENAHNVGDTAKVVDLINQLPIEDQPAMRSALGLPKVDTSVAPSTLPQEPSIESSGKRDVKAGQETLKGLANMSNSVDDFNLKLSQLPEDANVRAAIEKTGSQNIADLYHSVNPDPFESILGAVKGKAASAGQSPVKGIESLRNEQNALLSQERGKRFAASSAAGAEQSGSAGYFAQLAALKGEYTKIPHESLISDLGPERTENLFSQARDKINATPDSVYQELGLHVEGAKLNTMKAVRKVLGLAPGLPTTSGIKLLKIYSPHLGQLAEDNQPKFHQLMDFAAKAFGTVRGLKSTGDFSMGGRQGIFVAARHPVEWVLANKESVKYAGSGQYFKDQMQNIATDPWVKVGDTNGLQLPAASLKPEEQYAGSDIIQGHVAKDVLKVGNVVAGAERAYDGGLTYLRAALFKSRLQSFGDTPEAAAAKLGQKGVEGLTEAINTLTGRGGKDNGFVTKHINTLSETLFSPRLWASRLEPLNPKFWARIGPAGRQEALQSLGSFAAVASVVLGAAAASGAKVETDPRSSDFLKIKVGDTRYDILGGFQQNLVFGWREISGEKKSSTTGAVTKFAKGLPDLFEKNPAPVTKTITSPNRVSIATDLAGNKLNPVLSSAKKLISGKDASGQPVNYVTEIGQLFVPISIQGTVQTISSTGSVPEGILKNAPDYFGISSQTYGANSNTITTKQTKYLQSLQSKNAPKDQIDASKLFFQTIKTVPPKTYAYGQIDAAIKQGDTTKATQLAKDYNNQFSQAFNDWRQKYPQYRNDPTLTASYVSRQITDDELQQRIDKIKPGG